MDRRQLIGVMGTPWDNPPIFFATHEIRMKQEVSHKRVLAIALPMILSNLTEPLIGLVDSAVMGHLDDVKYLGAVSIAGGLFAFLFMVFNFLRMSTTGRAAQAYGAGDRDLQGRIFAQAMLLAMAFGIAMVLLQQLLADMGFTLMGAEPQVTEEAHRYFAIRIWSAPFALGNFVLVGWFIGLHDARAAMRLNLVINLANIVFDLLFVYGLGMTADGVGLASLLAETLGFATGMTLALRRIGVLAMIRGNRRLFPAGEFVSLMRMNRDLFLRSLSLMAVFMFFTAQGARQGEVILAANTVLLQFFALMAFTLDGFAHAAEALTGRVIGAGDFSRFGRVLRLTAIWSVGMAVLFVLLFLLAGKPLIGLMTSIEVARSATREYLPWLILVPVLGVWPFWLDGVFIGATWSRDMRNSMLLSTVAFFVVWLALRPMGNHGLWLAMCLFFLFRGLSMGWRLRGHYRAAMRGA